MESRGIGRAQQVALQGVQRSQSQLERAASSIARSGMQSPAAEVSISSEGRRLAQARASEDEPDLPGAIVDLGVSRNMSAANAAVLRTGDEMTSELLRPR